MGWRGRDAEEAEIGTKLAGMQRLPKVGGAVSGEVQTLPGVKDSFTLITFKAFT